MKITVPHMGNVNIAAKALFDGLNVEYIMPPYNSKNALEIGSLYSPEEMCLPFKIQIGNYIQAIKKGADTVIITGSCGPCRYGEYCELQINILKKLGHDINFIVIDSPGDIGKGELIKRIKEISSKSSVSKYKRLQAVYDAIKVINLIDKIEEEVHYRAGFEIEKGTFKKMLVSCKAEVMKAVSPSEMLKILRSYMKKIQKIKIDKAKNPLKIAIIGEIYTVIEPFSNLYIEDKLMDYGVTSSRMLTPSWWVKNMIMSSIHVNSLEIKRAAKKYIPFCIGGHAFECIGEAVVAEKNGFDGAIQIFPMGCMPEIVSKAILPKISKDKNFPVMTLIVDEMTGETGYITRIEAFIDLLERMKEVKMKKNLM